MKRCRFHSNSRGADEIKELVISTDFQEQEHGIVTPVQYYVSMVNVSWVKTILKKKSYCEPTLGANILQKVQENNCAGVSF